jgi:hypothetical protein
LAGKSRLGDAAAFTSLGNPNSNASSSKQKGMPQMKKLLFAAVAALALGGAANAATWWTLDSQDGACVAAANAARATGDPSFASPFNLAAEMRAQGRMNGQIQLKRTSHGSAYAVPYDGVMSVYFVSKAGCRDFLAFAQGIGDLPR